MGESTSISSGELSAGNNAVTANAAILKEIDLIPAAANATVKVYDGTDATGTMIASVLAVANGDSQHMHCNQRASNGLYVVVAGTGAKAVVRYT